MEKNPSKKYRLIREYPGSLSLNSVVSIEPKQETGYYSENKEYWQEVKKEVKKKYEILKWSFDYNNEYKTKSPVGSALNYEIFQVRRLSDSEIFTIGDRVKQSNVIHNNTFTITGFKFDVNNENLLVIGNGGIKLLKIEKVKAPILITEDYVEIYNNSPVYYVNSDYTFGWEGVILNNIYKKQTTGWYFSTREKADEYILLNKPVLSINDVKDNFVWHLNSANQSSKSIVEKLKELVKSKL